MTSSNSTESARQADVHGPKERVERSTPDAGAEPAPPSASSGVSARRPSDEILAKFHEQVRAEDERRRTYGNLRPIITIEFQGHRIVTVGSTIFYDARWRTFTDFLFDYLKLVFGRRWWEGELVKPIANRHPVLTWNDATNHFRTSHPPGPDGICSAVPDGPTQAYVALAYDLYILKDHKLLQERLVGRLKSRDQFQGVRYELFVTATCIRADYDIAPTDERDGSARHQEFTATHRPTGQQIDVEAKSRHRPGILAMRGPAAALQAPKVGIADLVRGALAKPATNPRVIFIDVNYPPEPERVGDPSWLPETIGTLRDVVAEHGNVIPWNMVVLTNHPYHYGPEGVTYPAECAIGHIAQGPRPPVANRRALMELMTAVNQFGKVPTVFPGEWE